MRPAVMQEAEVRGHEIKILDIGGGFPVPYDSHVKPLGRAGAARSTPKSTGCFAEDIEILAEPGPLLVATAATSVARVIGKARPRRQDLLLHRRQRLSHVFGHHFRPLPVSRQGVQDGRDRDLRGLRADLRRAGHHLPVRGIAEAGDRRPGLFRRHRRVQQRLGHLVQRLRAGESRARQRVKIFNRRCTEGSRQPGTIMPGHQFK